MRLDVHEGVTLEVTADVLGSIRFTLTGILYSDRSTVHLEVEGESVQECLRNMADQLDELREVF